MKARIPNQPNRNEMMLRIQKMQEDMQRVQEEVENAEYTASAGGGAVEVTVSGKHEILSIKMQPDVVDPDDIETLSDIIIAGVNEAIKTAENDANAEMSKITGGMGGLGGGMMPGLF